MSGWVIRIAISGDRSITCYTYRVDEKPMTSSVKKL